jgi:hypothetical protein
MLVGRATGTPAAPPQGTGQIRFDLARFFGLG